ncbi:MAG TPA: cobalt ECF transporter T component CbiQ [Gemmataceae bacterium]|jgi:cobalt/nickel transport system permease protein|nr:cobalt ECF transporter T component CbiQ [Gemmataceae bacterium]
MSLNPQHLAPRDSLLARRDPRWRLIAFTIAIVGVALLRDIWPVAIALAIALLLAFIGRVSGRWYRARIGFLLFALVPFLIVVPFVIDRGERLWEWRSLHVTDSGLLLAATLAMKTIALVTLAVTLFASAPLHVNLAAAGRLGVPKLLILLTLLTYRYVFLLLEEFSRLRIALRVRGFRNAMNAHSYRTIGQVTGTLLVRGSDRADRVAHAMRCRGFDGCFRTMATFRSTWQDALMFVLVAGVFGGLIAWDVWG